MNQSTEKQLIACLDALEQGQSIEEILARYPQEALVLRPMLEVADQLKTIPLAPTVVAKNNSRKQFLAEAKRLGNVNNGWQMPAFLTFLTRAWIPIVAVALILFVGIYTLSTNDEPNTLSPASHTATNTPMPTLTWTDTPTVEFTPSPLLTDDALTVTPTIKITPDPPMTPSPIPTRATITPSVTVINPTNNPTPSVTPSPDDEDTEDAGNHTEINSDDHGGEYEDDLEDGDHDGDEDDTEDDELEHEDNSGNGSNNSNSEDDD